MKCTGARGAEYPCRICKTEEAFGRRYLETDERRKKYDTCMLCADKERKKVYKQFEDSLLPEQKSLFEAYKKADDYFTSMVILD